MRRWDLASGEHLRTLTGHGYGVDGVSFSPDGRLLASGSTDETVRVWDAASGEHLRTLTHPANVCGVAFGPDGRLASACEDRTARLWDPASGENLRTFADHGDMVFEVAFSPDGRLLASGTGNGGVYLWPLAPAGH